MFTTKQFYHVLLAWEENTRVRPLRNFWPSSQYILFFGMTIFYLFNYFDLKNFYQIKLNVAQLGMVALSMRIYTLLVWLQVITCRSWLVTHSLRCFNPHKDIEFRLTASAHCGSKHRMSTRHTTGYESFILINPRSKEKWPVDICEHVF